MRVAALNISCMPKDDQEALDWLHAFAHSLASSPDLWPELRATEETSTRITALVKDFDEALRLAASPASDSAPDVRAKTEARNRAVLAVRAVINAARANPALASVHLARLSLPTARDVLERCRTEARRVRYLRRAV